MVRIASHLAISERLEEALDQCCRAVEAPLDGQVDLLMVFLSNHWSEQAEEISSELRKRLSPRRLVGCTGESIVGRGVEVEMAPAISLWAARLPDAEMDLLHLSYERTPDGGAFVGFPESFESRWPDDAALFLLGDPFTFPADLLIQHLEGGRAFAPLMGGMASGGSVPGANRLLQDDQVKRSGALLLRVGGVTIRSLVSQGCRPLGEHFVVTRAEGNVIQELGGQPILQRLQQLFDESPNREKRLLQTGLHLGRVVSEYQDDFQQGDFLVRNVLGVDEGSGGLAVGDYIRPGQTVQFHVRDAETADAELRELLSQAAQLDNDPAGALLFTCNGRGTRLFADPHHDAIAIRDALGDPPLAGFFAQGELGPVGGRNFMHGYTASIALWSSASDPPSM